MINITVTFLLILLRLYPTQMESATNIVLLYPVPIPNHFFIYSTSSHIFPKTFSFFFWLISFLILLYSYYIFIFDHLVIISTLNMSKPLQSRINFSRLCSLLLNFLLYLFIPNCIQLSTLHILSLAFSFLQQLSFLF